MQNYCVKTLIRGEIYTLYIIEQYNIVEQEGESIRVRL